MDRIHKKCSGIYGRLLDDPNYRCKRCTGEARPIDKRPMESITIGDFNPDVVSSFRYLGDVLGPGGGSVLSTTMPQYKQIYSGKGLDFLFVYFIFIIINFFLLYYSFLLFLL